MRDAFARKSPSMREIFVEERPSLREICMKNAIYSFYCQAKSMLIV